MDGVGVATVGSRHAARGEERGARPVVAGRGGAVAVGVEHGDAVGVDRLGRTRRVLERAPVRRRGEEVNAVARDDVADTSTFERSRQLRIVPVVTSPSEATMSAGRAKNAAIHVAPKLVFLGAVEHANAVRVVRARGHIGIDVDRGSEEAAIAMSTPSRSMNRRAVAGSTAGHDSHDLILVESVGGRYNRERIAPFIRADIARQNTTGDCARAGEPR